MSFQSNNDHQKLSIHRRGLLASAGLASVTALTAFPGPANSLAGDSGSFSGQQEGRKISGKEKSPAELMTPKTLKAIEKGLAYLARKQVRNGNFKGAFGSGSYAAGVATAGLSGLAFMAGGSVPGDGQYGQQVDRCGEYVMGNVSDSGFITVKSGGVSENMYGHGFAMLFLATLYGMTQKEEIAKKLRKAVKLTLKSQNRQGGWRYQPRPVDADLSVTVCQIMALRAARDSGINVPDDVRKKCIEYVKKSRNRDGSFTYTLGSGHSTMPLTAAGITSLYSAGIYDGPIIEKGLKYLNRFKPGGRGRGVGVNYYFYGHYYAVQAMWHAGGDYWNNWYPAIRDELIKSQRGDGSWTQGVGGKEYSTAMASIILQIPLNYIPVFAA